MLSTADLERLIAVKKREINKEKTLLGIASEIADDDTTIAEKDIIKPIKQVQFTKSKIQTERDDPKEELTKHKEPETKRELEEIPADLERYIRRYLGLPVMLKAGEYSPNNPLIRGERPAGDALLGLGEYERRRNTLRKIRQRQYREYLDQQAKIKQEAKEKAERERREREERERLQEERERERERERELERNVYSPERRRASVNYNQVSGANNAYSIKVDTGVQVNNISKPLSVAVQTDEDDIFRLSPTPRNLLTQAERELSPRTVVDSKDDRPIHPASWTLKEWKDPQKDWRDPPKEWKESKNWKDSGTNWNDPRDWKGNWKDPEPTGKGDWNEFRRELESDREWKESGKAWKEGEMERRQERRRSYGDFDERIKRASHEKASSETRTYKPSIFDADAIELRNLQAEKEAAARRQFYQRELQNQIMEQRRIREERKNREKMLEQAEMRRLEQQLRSLRAAQDLEIDRQHRLDCKIKDDDIEYDRKRLTLQKEIDLEQKSLIRATAQPAKTIPQTSKSDTFPSKLPFYYPKVQEKVVKTQENEIRRAPYSTNIPDSSVFSSNYDVESYLRRNLNPTRESLNSNRIDTKEKYTDNIETPTTEPDDNRHIIIEKALVHDRPKAPERKIDRPKVEVEPKVDFHRANERKDLEKGLKEDPLPIPVLRHSPKPRTNSAHEISDMSDAMKVVDDKWRVPVVQKNILKSLPNEEGKSVSILTQLGSIRRQLQLEQLKLDKMMCKDSDV